MQHDEQPILDPLFIGMTRPVTTLGVPVTYLGVLFIITAIGIIGFLSLKAKFMVLLFITLPLYGVGYMLTEYEPFWMHVYVTWLMHCPLVRNYRFWGCNSYMA